MCIKAYYCGKCKKTTRHIKLSIVDECRDTFVGRLGGTVVERLGLAEFVRFMENEYHYKCTNCGRISWRKADGTETLGYGGDK